MLEIIDTKPILAGLNLQQEEAVRTTEGPVLIVAGPGSGKTRVLTCRIAWLLASGITQPHKILALTFTNKAAREMRERVQKLLPAGMAKDMWVGTFHAQMVRLLRIEAQHLGYSSDFSIYDTADSERTLKKLIEQRNLDPKQIKPRAIRNYISKAKSNMQSLNQMASSAKSKQQEVAVEIYKDYHEELKRANAFDFDDLLLKPLELFSRHPDILEKYQRKWSHVLVDEYQDTNHVQYLLVYNLAKAHHNLCVVGDDAQSIYAFRGASIRNILEFRQDFAEAKVISLVRNYRSTQNILIAAGSLISKNENKIRGKGKLMTENGRGALVTLIEASDGQDEARRAVEIIRNQVAYMGCKYQDCAILYRTNIQSRNFEEAFRAKSIPYQVIGGTSFYQRKEVKDSVSYLRILVNPNDTASFQRAVNYPSRGIGPKTQEKILAYAQLPGNDLRTALDEIDKIPIPTRAKNSLSGFVEMIKAHAKRAKSGEDAGSIANSLFQESGLREGLKRDLTPAGFSRADNLDELLKAIQEHTGEDESHTLSTYLQSVSLITDADMDSGQPKMDRVSLMTLHASKGLEFKVVFIGGLEDRLLPLIHGEEDSPASIEEERRLFYVGITRAKSQLYLGRAVLRSRYGGKSDFTKLSPFVREIDQSVLKIQSTRAKRHPHPEPPKRLYGRFHDRYGGLQKSTYQGNRGRAASPRPSVQATNYNRPKDPPAFRVGVSVSHVRYGLGEVVRVEGTGNATTVTVDFTKFGRKQFHANYAPMKVIE